MYGREGIETGDVKDLDNSAFFYIIRNFGTEG